MHDAHRSFQNTLSSPSSLVSSSVTPPKRIPIPFDGQSVIVQPLRRHGAYASEGLLRFSHLNNTGGALEEEDFDLADGLEALDMAGMPDLEAWVVGVVGTASEGRAILCNGRVSQSYLNEHKS